MSDGDGRPPGLNWNYTRSELFADGAVHVVGIALGFAGAVLLVALAAERGAVELASVVVYATGLVVMLGVSAAYNMTPVSRLKWRLRSFDHSAIFFMIAGTYTPFITQIENVSVSLTLLAWVWSVAFAGVALKIVLPGRFDRVSIALYLLMSWSGVLAWESVAASLPATSVRLLAAGGLVYTAGILFHVWESLRFQNAIWHGFVLVAAACHFGAVLDCMVLARA